MDSTPPADTSRPANIPAVAARLFDLMEPLSPDERRRSIHAALVMLGDSPLASLPVPGNGSSALPPSGAGSGRALAVDAQKWLKKHDLVLESLEEYFQLDDEVAPFTLPDGVPQSDRERTKAAYLLQGVAALLGSGRPAFADDAAREFCKRLGCYDENNHSKYVKAMDDQLIGSKAKGYTLTQPGLATAAGLLKGSRG